MSQHDRLRFFTTLFSAYTSRRQRADEVVLRWLTSATKLSKSTNSWNAISEELIASLGNAIQPNLRQLIEEQLHKMVAHNVDVVTRLDKDYPEALHRHLGEKAPLFLWFRGNRDLFSLPAVGFCGSRHASELGLGVCSDIVGQLVTNKVVAVAGYAAGVDQTAHLTALREGGNTIAVLADGILNFGVRELLAEDWHWDHALIVSEFLPQKRWSVAQAMQRNRTIIGLGSALVVIEAGETGGTFEAGKEALSLKHPLFAPIYGSIEGNVVGNKILISRGALPIMKSKSTGKAKVDQLLSIVQGAEHAQFAAEPHHQGYLPIGEEKNQ